jgi:hypothetical protein
MKSFGWVTELNRRYPEWAKIHPWISYFQDAVFYNNVNEDLAAVELINALLLREEELRRKLHDLGVDTTTSRTLEFEGLDGIG